MKAWELAESGATPIVTYICVESDRGTTLGATFADEGRPVFAWHGPADTNQAAAKWFGFAALDERSELIEGEEDKVPLHCRWHGYWMFPRSVMLDDWTKARRTKPKKVKVDESSPWYRGA